jgi:hypothetical protein
VAVAAPETPVETTLETVSAANSAPERADSAIPTSRLRQTSSLHCCLPRFHRAKGSHRPPLALQARDLELLRTAHDYRLITTPQYFRLFSDDSRDGIYRRLQKLFHHGYLDRLGTNPNAPMLYALAKRGADVLEVSARKDVGDRYVAHQLMIGDFRIALTHAAGAHGIDLTWRTLPQALPVRPDGFFSLQFPELPEGRNRAFFMLEADRSTMPRERFVEKLRAYRAWHLAGGHTEALGIRTFRVLTVTRSDERLGGLVRAAREAGEVGLSLRHFWFASEKRFTAEVPGAIFGWIWETPDRPGEFLSLLP